MRILMFKRSSGLLSKGTRPIHVGKGSYFKEIKRLELSAVQGS